MGKGKKVIGDGDSGVAKPLAAHAAPPKAPPAATIATSSAVDAGGATAGAKKKKRKKKKKAAGAAGGSGGASDDEDDDDSGALIGQHKASPIKTSTREMEGSNKLDPVELTIRECVKRGYGRTDVETTIGEMFETGKPYDNVDAVIREIKRKNVSGGDDKYHDDEEPIPPELLYDEPPFVMAGKSNGHASKSSPIPPPPAPVPQKSNTQQTAPVEKAAPAPAPSANKSSKAEKKEKESKSSNVQSESEKQAAPPKQQQQTPVSPAAAPVGTAAKSAPPASLEQRLELASSHDHVEDSLSALTGYAKIAQADGQRALIASKALDIILKNIFKRCLAQPKGYPSGFSKEIGLFLTHFLGTAKPLDDLVAIIKHVQALNANHVLSNDVLDLIVKSLASSMKESKKQFDASKTAGSDLAEVETRLKQEGGGAKRAGKTTSIKELFELRDKHSSSISLQEAACRILVAQCNPASAFQQVSNTRSKSADNKARDNLVDAVLKDSLGVSSEQLKEKRREIASVKAELASVSSSMEGELQPLVQEAAMCKNQLLELRSQREVLIRQLAELDDNIKGVESRLQAREKTVVQRREAFEKSLADKDKRLKGMLSVIRQADDADDLAKKLETMSNTIQEELQSSRAGQKGEMEKKLRSRIKAFADGFEPYLDVEVRCYEFLKHRSEQLETEKAKVQGEIGHYKAMGLAANVQELVNKANASEEYIKEDRMAMANLRDATAKHYEAFRAALDCAGGPGADWMINAGISLVNIKQSLDRMGLAKDWLPGLAAIPSPSIPILSPVSSPPMNPIAPPSASKLIHQTQPLQQNAARPPKAPPMSPQQSPLVSGTVTAPPSRNLAPGAPVSKPMPPPPSLPQEKPAPAPAIKFSWANRVTSSSPTNGAAEKKSLVQIQEEERQSRLTEENLRRLEDGEAKLKAKLAFIAKDVGSSEVELNSTTDRTDRTLGSEGLNDGGAAVSGLSTISSPATAGGAPGLSLGGGAAEKKGLE